MRGHIRPHRAPLPILLSFASTLLLAGISLVTCHAAEELPGHVHADSLVIDLSARTGPLLHGASGWLYGQAAPSIPSVNIMEPLQPQISAQKPDGGLQHPMGDASLVAPSFRAAHGKRMQIYLQDIYPDWTYNDLGIDDYLHKVDTMTRQIVNDPNHDLFVYVPFNEPNNNWYADNGPRFTKFLQDWMLVYREIRAIDPGATIAGPGFEHFNDAAFETFLAFARDNHVLPNEFIWHELHDDFFPQWYRRVATYRASETKLGIAPLPIVINEYARARGDLGVPGNLIQWISRLENSKVYGCLAFWTPSGTLADLAARIWPNRPTGAWWLYQWYGSMTGDTVQVTPPETDAIGLQGIASLDASKQQARVVFGGTSKPIDLIIRGLGAVPGFGAGVHSSLMRTADSGIEPSPQPQTIAEANHAVAEPQLLIHVPAAPADSAYLLVLTPRSSSPAKPPGEHLAVEADLSGNATAEYDRPEGSSVLLSPAKQGTEASVRFIAAVDHDGFYGLHLRYGSAPGRLAALVLDSEPARSLTLAPFANSGVREQTLRVFLAAGVHRFRFWAAEQNIRLYSFSLMAAEGPIVAYPAASSENALSGTAHTMAGSGGHQVVAGIGGGSANFIEFRSVKVKAAGLYAMIVTYSNDEQGHKGQVDEQTDISVNSAPKTSAWFRNTFDDSVFATTVVTVQLKAGENRIRFSNPKGRAPVIESIQIAGPDD